MSTINIHFQDKIGINIYFHGKIGKIPKMSTINIHYHDKIGNILKMSIINIHAHDKTGENTKISLTICYQKNFLGAQKRVRISQGKRVIDVRAIEVQLHFILLLLCLVGPVSHCDYLVDIEGATCYGFIGL